MYGYDYGNARLRVMKSRLLSRRELEALLDVESLQGLIASLTRTAYRKPVEAALARTSGMDCIAEALLNDLINTLGRVNKFYRGHAREMTAIVMRSYDVHNLKAVLRGLDTNAPPGEILDTLLPIGELEYDLLVELARTPGPRVCIDLLASMGLMYARPLLVLRAEHPGAETTEMELALDKWYFREAFLTLQSIRRDGSVLFSAMQLEADLANMLTLLRFANAPAERELLRKWLDTEGLEYLFVGPGSLPFSLLAHAGGQDSVDAAVEILSGTPYEPQLNAGLTKFSESARLSDFEKQFLRFRVEWMANQIQRDPLGIGVLLGYIALKITEVRNIRWIAQGINLGITADSIRAELEIAP